MTLDPTWPPTLLASVRSRAHHRVLVTGFHTTLGRAVAEAVHEVGADVVRLDGETLRVPVDARIEEDLTPTAGLDVALQDVQAVIHCAAFTSPLTTSENIEKRTGARKTRELLDAICAWAPRAHLVLPSHLGCWEASLPAFRAQADVENIALSGTDLVSIARLGVLHPHARHLASAPADVVTGRTTDISITPTDPAWVARTLVEVALTRRPFEEPLELAGPETLTLADMVTLTAHLNGRSPRRVLALPYAFGGLRPLAAGVHLPTEATRRGGQRYDQWWDTARTQSA